MEILVLLVFVSAVSLDGFGAGFAYGLRKIRLPFHSMLIISLTSGLAISISLFLGHTLTAGISPFFAEILGGNILILIGFWVMLQSVRQAHIQVLQLRIPVLGIVVKILIEPAEADLDNSGYISIKEALLIGIALALDVFAAGIALALAGYQSISIPFSVTAGIFIMLNLGIMLGRKSSVILTDKMHLLPGSLLVGLGLTQIFMLLFK